MGSDPFLVGYLADRDIPCPGCRYNLRGLQGSACPECGADLSLRVGLTEPRLGVFVAILVALSSGFGFNVFLLGWGVWAMFNQGFPTWQQLWSVVFFSVVLGALVALLLRSRRWVRARGRVAHGALIVGAAALSIGSVVVFFSMVT